MLSKKQQNEAYRGKHPEKLKEQNKKYSKAYREKNKENEVHKLKERERQRKKYKQKIKSSASSSSTTPRSRAISEGALLAIQFYNRSENYVILPGKKDVMTINVDGGKKKVQKRVFVKSLEEMYREFMRENPNVKLGISHFLKLYPKDILSFTKMPSHSCLCKSHENLRLAYVGSKQFITDETITNQHLFYEVIYVFFYFSLI